MRKAHPALGIVSVAIFAFLYLPLLCVTLFSVNASRLGVKWGGFTVSWYVNLFHDEVILKATWNTLLLAVISTAVSTVLGTLLAIGIHRTPWSRKFGRVLDLFLNLPVVTPDIIFAVALVIAFGALRAATGMFELGLPTMIIGHVAFQISFVALAVKGRLEMIGSDLEEAAFDLYAGHLRMMTTVILPLLKPGIFAGAALAFTLSLDDFVISFFTAGPDSMTLPIFIYAAVHRGITPEIHALSTLVMLATIAAVALMQTASARSERKEQA